MPPFALWLQGRDEIARVVCSATGIGCEGSRLRPDRGQRLPGVRPVPAERPDGGYEPWALQVLEISRRADRGLNSSSTPRLFPLFGLPTRLDA